MGITEIFENTADLPGILKGPPVKVNKIVQKSYIEVNEEGSEAAATTGKLLSHYHHQHFHHVLDCSSLNNKFLISFKHLFYFFSILHSNDFILLIVAKL